MWTEQKVITKYVKKKKGCNFDLIVLPTWVARQLHLKTAAALEDTDSQAATFVNAD